MCYRYDRNDGSDDWDGYSLDVSAKILSLDSEDSALGVCFGVTDPNNSYQLKITPTESRNVARIKVLKKQFFELITLSEFEVPFQFNQWQRIHTCLNTDWIGLKIEEFEHKKIEIDSKKIVGGIGFKLEGNITAYFDDIHVRKSSTSNHHQYNWE